MDLVKFLYSIRYSVTKGSLGRNSLKSPTAQRIKEIHIHLSIFQMQVKWVSSFHVAKNIPGHAVLSPRRQLGSFPGFGRKFNRVSISRRDEMTVQWWNESDSSNDTSMDLELLYLHLHWPINYRRGVTCQIFTKSALFGFCPFVN